MSFLPPKPATKLRACLLAALAAASSCGKREPEFTLRIESGQVPSGSIQAVVSCDTSFFKNLPRDPSGGLIGASDALQIRMNGGRLFASIALRGRDLVLTPAVPLPPGAEFSVHFNPEPFGIPSSNSLEPLKGVGPMSGRNSRLGLIHTIPDARPLDAPKLVSINPTASSLPANHLKFYLSFSQPMEQGVFMERIRLLRGDGSEVAGPFRETELWSPDGKRLTVWLHPGRQKTGVNLNEDEGPVLKPGDGCILKVDGKWRSVSGSALGRDAERAFHVGAAVHDKVNVMQWAVHPPAQGSRDPLRIVFPRPLDWALLQNAIRIIDARRQPVAGRIEIPDGESEWRLAPDVEWTAGRKWLQVDPVLEDLAGNNLDGPFEVDASRQAEPRKSGPVELPVPLLTR